MNPWLAKLTAQPSTLYRKNPQFYLVYDLVYIVGFAAVTAAIWGLGWRGVVSAWTQELWLLLPAVLYLHVLANVCVHNACHGNFPRSINRIVGEILGVVVVVRFASWEIIHVRHHRYPDDPTRDPHYVQPSFARFLAHMAVNVERQLQNIHYDQFGDTPANRRHELIRSVVSFVGGVACVVFWFVLLGPSVFFFLFVPAQLFGWMVVSHFNWSTHNASSITGDFRPVNLDTGLYWLGNRILFGLYMHANHHKRAFLFNPLRLNARR